MAETADAPPSMEGIFRILAQIPQDRLVWYKHKLNHAQQDRRIFRLLRTMILLTLNQEAEARASLDALGYDLVAAHIYRSHWGSAKASKADPVPPKLNAEVALAVAQIYEFLAEEKLCDPLARDEAYRAAVRAFRESQVEPAQLKSLLDEVQEKYGVAFASMQPRTHTGVLTDDPGRLPAQPAESHPVPILSSLDPHSLRSTGTPLSFVSHFEISLATTMPCATGSDQEPGPEPSKVCRSTCAHLGSAGGEETGLESPTDCCSSAQDGELQNTSAGAFRSSPPCLPGPADPRAARPVEGDAQRPVHCTDFPTAAGREPRAPKGGLPQHLDTPSVAGSSSPNPAGWSPKSAQSPSPPTPKRDAKLPDSPDSAPSPHPMGPSPVAPPGDENQFFSFVILHAGEDEEVACRVKSELERLGVSNGATYSEDFLVPGSCQLSCFQNALDNSAFTLLLLTENFQSRFCAYQTSVALMDSFQRFCKSNTVIPFVPRENPIPQKEMPATLAGLVPLNETSPVFSKRVKNTFTPRVIQEKKAMWEALRQVHERRRQQERDREYQQILRRLSELSTSEYPPAPPAGFPGFQALPGHLPQPPLAMPFPAPGMGQPPMGPDHPSLSQPFLVSLGAGGPQPQFIIQNAQMIQIGDYNHMQAERPDPTLGATDEGIRED